MHFKTLRAMSVFTSAISVSTRSRSEIIKSYVCLLKTSDAFRQRSSSWRPLTECTRRFPEGIRNCFLFPFFTGLFWHLTEIAEVHYTPVTLIRIIWKAWLRGSEKGRCFPAGWYYSAHFSTIPHTWLPHPLLVASAFFRRSNSSRRLSLETSPCLVPRGRPHSSTAIPGLGRGSDSTTFRIPRHFRGETIADYEMPPESFA